MGNKLSTRSVLKKKTLSQDADKTVPLGSQVEQLFNEGCDFDDDPLEIPSPPQTPIGPRRDSLRWQQDDSRAKWKAVVMPAMSESEAAENAIQNVDLENLEYSAFLAQSARTSSPRRAGKNEDNYKAPQATLRRTTSRSGKSKLVLDVRVDVSSSPLLTKSAGQA